MSKQEKGWPTAEELVAFADETIRLAKAKFPGQSEQYWKQMRRYLVEHQIRILENLPTQEEGGDRMVTLADLVDAAEKAHRKERSQ